MYVCSFLSSLVVLFSKYPMQFPSAQRVKQLVSSGEFDKITSIKSSDFARLSLLFRFGFLKDDISLQLWPQRLCHYGRGK